MDTINKKTAIHNEQQSKTVVIDEIIKMIASYNSSIEEANKILMQTSKKINQQTVRFSR